MSRPEYATTKYGLIRQVREAHEALEAMTADRDRWREIARRLHNPWTHTGALEDYQHAAGDDQEAQS